MSKRIFRIISNLIIILSLIFLTIYLIKNDELKWIEIKNYSYFIISIVSVLIGFFIEIFAFQYYLKENSISLDLSQSTIITGKFILTKYIPGKVGIILGKASYLYNLGYSAKSRILYILIVFQIYILISALLVSVIPLYSFFISITNSYLPFLICLVIAIVFLTQRTFQQVIIDIIKKVFNKEISAFYLPFTPILVTLLLLVLRFFIFSIGFYFLALSLGFDAQLIVGFVFPLATVVGIIALFAPGGVGVREGIIAAGLIFLGYTNKDAISLSVFSRVWFLITEFIFFIVSFAFSLKKTKS